MIRDIADTIVRRVLEQADPVRIYVFGSAARGEARPDSDLDILVVEDGEFGSDRARWRELSKDQARPCGYRGAEKTCFCFSRARVRLLEGLSKPRDWRLRCAKGVWCMPDLKAPELYCAMAAQSG